MGRLILLRHGKAVPHGAAPDFERSLVARGIQDSRAAGEYLRAESILPDRVLISPAYRTRETWQAVSSTLGECEIVNVQDLYLASSDQLLESIQMHGDPAQTLLVVGHNPSLHDLAVELIDHGDRYAFARLREHFPTAALVVLDSQADTWAQLRRHSMRLDRFHVSDPEHNPLNDL